MKWFRSNIRQVAQLALFALIVQFALSFGHVHAIAPQSASAAQVGVVQSARSDAAGIAAPAAADQSAQQPASDHRSDDHAGDVCAICAVMAMANAMLFAAPPVLRLPQAIDISYSIAEAAFARIASVRGAFQPRAPPSPDIL